MVEIVEKPWGREIIWAKTESYVGKILYIEAGKRLSFQFHEKKEETVYVKSGILYLETAGMANSPDKRKTVTLSPGETFHVYPLLTHRFMAKESDVELIEVSTNHLEDVVRLEDDYNRINIKRNEI